MCVCLNGERTRSGAIYTGISAGYKEIRPYIIVCLRRQTDVIEIMGSREEGALPPFLGACLIQSGGKAAFQGTLYTCRAPTLMSVREVWGIMQQGVFSYDCVKLDRDGCFAGNRCVTYSITNGREKLVSQENGYFK